MSTNPYPGLRSFEYTENHLFFGREGQAAEVATRLEQSHFLAVVGTSGSGKSSLVRAGLLPLLYGGRRFDTNALWRIALMRPGETPIRNLAQALVEPEDFGMSEMFGEEENAQQKNESLIGITEATLRRSGVGLLDFIKTAGFDESENLLIVVDQFEELFRFKQKTRLDGLDEAAAFVKLLLEATRDKESRIYVVITMRSDFLGDCAEFRDLPEAINKGQYLIPRMTREQLRLSIESPAKVFDAKVSDVLVNRLLNDLEQEQNQSLDIRERMLRDRLPILQHALMRTWEVWKDTSDEMLDIKHYKETGEMAFALSNHADEAFADLDKKDKKIERQRFIAEKMFKCLTETDNESRQTRRPAKIEEICAVAGVGDEKEVFEVIDIFREEKRTFLMPPPYIKLTRETMIDISHESLIRNWTKLKSWVEEEAEDAAQYRRLAGDALLLEEYKINNKDILEPQRFERDCKSYLWRGIELKDALEWRDRFKPNENWALRYQVLTNKEKLHLSELSRTAPDEEPEKRREFIQHHFHEVMKFLDASAKNEAEELAEKERIQQERIAFERQKAEAAEQLAKVEKDKVEGLQNLTKSLKRQRRILFAVSVFSILMMLATSIAAIVAWQYYNSAKVAQTEAEKNKQEAEKNAVDAINQKSIAIDEKQRADEEKLRAEDNLKEADKQKKLALDNLAEANKQKQIAEDNEKEALSQKQKAIGLAKEVEEKAATELAALKKFDNERKINEINLKALSSFENSNYENAEKAFQDLLTTIGKDDKEREWWIYYNLAKTHHQLGNFDETEDYFKQALGLAPIAINNSPFQFAQVNFFRVSDTLSNADTTDLAERRITTLRKYAQFFRSCATAPEDCFVDGYSVNKSAAQEEDFDVITPYLYTRAIKTYEDLLEIKQKPKDSKHRDRLLLNEVNDRVDLADTYLTLGQMDKETKNFAEAEKNYAEAIKISIIELELQKPLFIISVQKKLLTSALYQNDLAKADIYARAVIDERGKIFPDKETLPYQKDMINTYKDLARIYRGYRQKLIEEGEEKINEEKRRKEYKLEVIYRRYVTETKTDLSEQKTDISDKTSNTGILAKITKLREVFTTNESISDRETSIKFLDNMEKLLNESSRISQLYSALASEYALTYAVEIKDWEDMLKREKFEIFSFLNDDLKIIGKSMAKEYIFTTIADTLKKINAGAPPNADENFDNYYSLAILYAANNDCKAAAVIAKADSLVEEHYQKNKSNAESVRLRLSSLKEIADFYELQLGNFEESAKAKDNYKRVLTDVKTTYFQKLTTFDSKREYLRYYEDAGLFLYKQGGNDKYSKAIDMFKEYSDFLKGSEASIKPNTYSYEWGKERVFLERVNVDILIGLTYEKDAKPLEAAALYKNLLNEIESRTTLKQKPVTNQNNANVSTTNSNVSVTNANTTPNANLNINANVNRNTNVNTNVNTMANTSLWTSAPTPSSPIESLIKESVMLEAYLRTRLAALYLSRGENETDALKLLNEKAQTQIAANSGISYRLYTVEGYASALVAIGDFMRNKQQNNQLAAQYYQRAVEAFKYIDTSEGRLSKDTENYVNSSMSYSNSSEMTKEFYSEYIRVLRLLENAGGKSDNLTEEIKDAESKKEKAPLAGVKEGLVCKE